MAYKVGQEVRIIETGTEIDGDVGTIIQVMKNQPMGINGKVSYVVATESDNYILQSQFVDLYL